MQARAKKPIYRQYKSAQTTQYFSGQNKIKKKIITLAGAPGILQDKMSGYIFGVWLSLVERYVRDVEVASSNLVTPT